MTTDEAVRLIEITVLAAIRFGMNEGDIVTPCRHSSFEVQVFHEEIAKGSYRELRRWIKSITGTINQDKEITTSDS